MDSLRRNLPLGVEVAVSSTVIGCEKAGVPSSVNFALAILDGTVSNKVLLKDYGIGIKGFYTRRSMEKIHHGNGFTIIEKDGEYQISWAQGPYDLPVFYPISKKNMEKAFKSEQDAQEVMYYAETGTWKSKTNEELENNKEFIRGFPELLIKIPTNQELFSDEELKVLLPLAQKALE